MRVGGLICESPGTGRGGRAKAPWRTQGSSLTLRGAQRHIEENSNQHGLLWLIRPHWAQPGPSFLLHVCSNIDLPRTQVVCSLAQ